AVDIYRNVLGEAHPHTALSYSHLGLILHTQENYATAIPSLEASARSYEAARHEVAVGGLERAAFGAERSPYPLLSAAWSRVGKSIDAWAALETNLARGLLDEMAVRRGSGFSPAEQGLRDELRARRSPIDARILALVTRAKRTDEEAPELQRLIDQRKKLEKSLSEVAVAASRLEVAPLAQLQAALPADAAFVAWVDVFDKSGVVQEHWGCVVRPSGDPNWERLPGTGTDGKWTKEDTELSNQLRAALAK